MWTKMVNFSANIRMSPIGLILIAITMLSTVFYFRDMIQQSHPMKKFAHLSNVLKAQGHNLVGFYSPEISLKELLVASIEVAKRGGVQVKNVRESNNLKESSKGQTDEGVNDPLTQGDLLSHRVMYNSFKISWSNLKVISEEKDSTIPQDLKPVNSLATDDIDKYLTTDDKDEKVSISDVTVWIDPLDATKEYAENLKQYVTTMVCVAVKGMPVIGVIYKPFTDKVYWGWYMHGSHVDSSANKHKQPVFIVSRSHAGNVNQTARKAFGSRVKVIPAGGAGYKVIALATGKADAYIHSTKIKKWDVCAGNAILKSLSGDMTDLRGNDIGYGQYDGVVLQHGLLATMKNHRKYLRKLGYR